MKRLLLVGSIAFLAISCSKSSNNNNNPVVPSGDYMVFTANSTWTYSSSTDGTPAPDYTLTMTNIDTMIGTRSYKILTNSAGVNNYQAKSGNDYYRFGKFDLIAPNGIEELYLKADAATGSQWTINLPPMTIPPFGNVTATGTYTIKGRDLSKTVLGTAFNNKVIHVELIGKASMSGFQTTVLEGNFYYAKGVGLISYTLKTMPPGSATSTTQVDLKAYTIK